MRLAGPWCVPVVTALLSISAACTVCKPATYESDGYASATAYSADIAACQASTFACDSLCRDALGLSSKMFLARCAITSIDSSGGAVVHARYADTTTCSAGDIDVDGVVYDDTIGDSADDGSMDDGSTSDGGDSGDSGDDGGDDGGDGGDDDLRAPSHHGPSVTRLHAR